MAGPPEGPNRDRQPARARPHSSSLARHGTPASFGRAKNAVSDFPHRASIPAKERSDDSIPRRRLDFEASPRAMAPSGVIQWARIRYACKSLVCQTIILRAGMTLFVALTLINNGLTIYYRTANSLLVGSSSDSIRDVQCRDPRRIGQDQQPPAPVVANPLQSN